MDENINHKESDTLLIVESSSNFIALWLTSFFLAIPMLFLMKFPSLFLFIIILIAGTLLYYLIRKESNNEKVTLKMMKNKLELKNTIVEYDNIEYFQFVGYKAEKKRIVDKNWWTPITLQLHIHLRNNNKIWTSIPNQLGNAEYLKKKIRNILHSKTVNEKKEKLR